MKPGLFAFVSAVVGAISIAISIPLEIIGLMQMNDLDRYQNWLAGNGGMPPATVMAGTIMGSVGLLLLLIAIAMAIYNNKIDW